MSKIFSAIAVIVTLCLSASAEAQQAKLTWIRYFQLSPGSRTDLVKTARTPFDRMLADGTIAAWGVVEPVARVGEPFSHGMYVTVPDWKAVDAVVTAMSAAGLTGTEHTHDVVLRHIVQSETPPVAKPKYLVVNLHPVNRGRESDALHLFNEWAKPVFTKLAAGGKLGPWGLSTQNIVIDNQWTHMVWYFIADTSVLEDINTALAEVGWSQLTTYERRLRAMSEDDYIGQLLRVVHSAP